MPLIAWTACLLHAMRHAMTLMTHK